MYVTDIQRDIGVITVGPLPLVRQYHNFEMQWDTDETSDTDEVGLYTSSHTGVFDYGYYSHECATKIQAIVRGRQARDKVPMVRMVKWIVNNLVNKA